MQESNWWEIPKQEDPLITTVSISDELSKSYLSYGMSVIVSRALPDARDGLKPVHRRILYGMYTSGNNFDKPLRKSARAVGEVMGKYHPHGDASIYNTIVKLSQEFNMSVPLIEGQGNFGSMDGDNPAGMRYTEVKLKKIATTFVKDIKKSTVKFLPNYDGQDKEPSVLPCMYPNLYVNGTSGIAVGMSTNIPPHNLGEMIDAVIALINNPNITCEELREYVKGPDYPTGGSILSSISFDKLYEEGKGSVKVRAKHSVEEVKGFKVLVFTELPYKVNKQTLCEKIQEVSKETPISDIVNVRDETGRDGVRVVVELKKTADEQRVLNQLYKLTPLENSYSYQIIALNQGKPETFTLLNYLEVFIQFRENVIINRTKFDLEKDRNRCEILCGLAVAAEYMDEIIPLIKESESPKEAKNTLLNKEWDASSVSAYINLIDNPIHKMTNDGKYFLSNDQVSAILNLRLQKLTKLNKTEIFDELKELSSNITNYLTILNNRETRLNIIVDELNTVKKEFAVPRRTNFV